MTQSAIRAEPEECRRVRRRQVYLAGAVAAAASPADYVLCFMHDLTDDGAQLELASLRPLEGRVQVNLPSLECRLTAEVIWQQAQRVGLRFVKDDASER